MTSTPSSGSSPPRGSFASATTRRERLRQLTVADVGVGLRALVLFPVLAVALRRRGLRRVQQRLLATRRRPSPAGGPAAALDEARKVAWIVEAAADRGPWPANCLQRSLVLWWTLHRRGIDSELRIGVRRAPGAQAGGTATMEFHAWIEHAGVVLNEVADIRRRFATFDRAIAPADARFR